MKQTDINKAKRAQEHVSKAIAALIKIGRLDLTTRESRKRNYAVVKLTDTSLFLRMWVNELTKEE